MATQTVKTTYSLDIETIQALETLARRWRVSKSEALRRSIRASAARPAAEASRDALRALEELQRSVGLDLGTAERWQAAVRAERRAASRRGERKPG